MLSKKSLLLVVIMFLLLSLSGCRKKIPDGEIKNFVLNFDYDKAYNNTLSGESVRESLIYNEGILEGTITIYTYFDKSNGLYHYSKTVVSGSYYGVELDQYNYHEKETITYLDENGNVVAYEKVDGQVNQLTYIKSDLEFLINNFFYTELSSGYHQGGTYYGDYIYANCAKYYKCFSLNEDKSQLIYQINTMSTDKLKNEVVTMHKFNVNPLGMVLDLSTKTMYRLNQDTYTESKLNCNYQPQFIKIYAFN